MPDTKSGRDKKALDEEKRQRRREIRRALKYARDSAPQPAEHEGELAEDGLVSDE